MNTNNASTNDASTRNDAAFGMGRATGVASAEHGSAGELARTAGVEVRQGVEHAAEAAKLKLAEVKDRTMEQVDAARNSVKHASDSLAETVVRHPLTSIGIAAGVGILVGVMLVRPRI